MGDVQYHGGYHYKCGGTELEKCGSNSHGHFRLWTAYLHVKSDLRIVRSFYSAGASFLGYDYVSGVF